MPEHVLVDNDVALKIACYTLVDEAVAATSIDGVPPAMLGVGRFVIRGRLARARNITDAARAGAAFERLLRATSLVEPNDAEIALAAEFEAEANRGNLELDSGESQLLAILVTRACRLLVTGDKRAIVSMAIVAPVHASARIACLEQLIAHIVGAIGSMAVRAGVCAEPGADRAVTLCFSCGSPAAPADGDVLAALISYVGHLDRAAPGVLLPGAELT